MGDPMGPVRRKNVGGGVGEEKIGNKYTVDEISAFHDKALAVALGVIKERDELRNKIHLARTLLLSIKGGAFSKKYMLAQITEIFDLLKPEDV